MNLARLADENLQAYGEYVCLPFESLPKSPVSKILRKELRKQI
jgi:hypothetical protein